ncbi:DNA repair protein RecO [Eremococcus coleocola]|uniref:DNA repair protein RecO n=1 Tax=Eremococcus coleocola ACS-139-V-Col8 TaxID=908337 RepID=E4KM26_9LACT|nr:DNA repair protein RecO [Eremococcus coleocola]EFR31939.1 DNA repair protein RecO [Eremococcus coleocola ACS-139-V-Col8]
MNERFEGIVLFNRPYKEDDALIKVFTDRFGTKMFYLKHVKKPNHPLASQMIPLTRHEFVGMIHDQGFSFLREGTSLDMYRSNQVDYKKQVYTAYISQLVDAAIDDNVPNLALYQLLRGSLEQINQGQVPELITHFVEIHLLPLFGTQLNWQTCQVCDSQQEPADFSIKLQGRLCPHHLNHDPYRMHLNPRALHIAALLAGLSLDQLGQINLSKQTYQELRRLMDAIYQEFVGIRLRSKHYLDQMDQIAQKTDQLKVKRQARKSKDKTNSE